MAENEGWVSRLQVRFGSAFGVGTGVVEGDKGKGRDEVGAEGETSGAGVATRAGGDRLAKMRASKGVGMARSRPRSVSSPPAFHQTQYQQHQPPGAGPPLKQHLLAVLRMRLSEGGGSSRGGEAGLRFKKYVPSRIGAMRTTRRSSRRAITKLTFFLPFFHQVGCLERVDEENQRRS